MYSIEDIKKRNPWWDNKSYSITEKNLPARDLFKTIEENLSHTLILNIIGLRRVGKSTILRQIVCKLLEQGVKKENIFYFLFDYTLQPQSEGFLNEVLETYFTKIKKEAYPALRETVYILLDEIQYIDNWQSVLKRFYDLSSKNIKFIITGSQSLLLKNKYRESLAGRIFDFYLPPLSFREFLRIKGSDDKPIKPYDLFELPEVDRNLSGASVWQGPKMMDFAKEYVIFGQFPELISDEKLRKDYILTSVIGKIFDDCIRIYNIEKTDEFKELAFHLINNASSIYELSNIGREIAVSRLTLEKFVEYYKESFLVEILYRYNKSFIKRGKMLKKSYSTSVNFNCALLGYNVEDFDRHPEIFGKIIENVIYNVLRQKYNNKGMMESLSFWRKGEKEIDFIVSKRITIPNEKEKLLPIEVKFSNNISFKDSAVLTDYIKKNKLEYGIVVTRNEIAQKEINGAVLYFIPYYLMLLMI